MSAEPIKCAGCGKPLHMDEHDAPPHECIECETRRLEGVLAAARKEARKDFQGARLVHVVVHGCAECPHIEMTVGSRRSFFCMAGKLPRTIDDPVHVGAPEWCPLPFDEVRLTVEQRKKFLLASGSCGQCPRTTGRMDCGIDLEASCPIRDTCGLPPSEQIIGRSS